MRWLVSFAFAALVILPSEIDASCIGAAHIKTAADEASAVFVGKVTKISRGQLASAALAWSPKGEYWVKHVREVDVVSFAVTEPFKPAGIKTIEILKDAVTFVGDRDVYFKVGEVYLVYAFQRRKAGSSPTKPFVRIYSRFPKQLAKEIEQENRGMSRYETGLYNRTRTISFAGEDLVRLRCLFAPTKSRSRQVKGEYDSVVPARTSLKNR